MLYAIYITFVMIAVLKIMVINSSALISTTNRTN